MRSRPIKNSTANRLRKLPGGAVDTGMQVLSTSALTGRRHPADHAAGSPLVLRPGEATQGELPSRGRAAQSFFFVLNTNRYGTADWPSASLKLWYFSLLSQTA